MGAGLGEGGRVGVARGGPGARLSAPGCCKAGSGGGVVVHGADVVCGPDGERPTGRGLENWKQGRDRRAGLWRQYKVRTGKVFGSQPLREGDMLFYAFHNIHVLRNFCESNVVLYLGKKIFLSKDNFESSLPPLIIPKSMRAGGASVTSALFTSESKLLLVVNKKVYIYNYLTEKWIRTGGISGKVSHVSGDSCCFHNEFCLELSNRIFAYLRGGPLPNTKYSPLTMEDSRSSSCTVTAW
ncbi:cation channel sperm-associated protein subunit delta [Onychomys torridus]|uniref:cation channel sperm-associated protein subunit delta n=1 Tax=Onychomys torridus TaxID=38674 RepID=UPI00167F2094|nr:cation channel sperm-associated protein subunit delta [Onychomys torridus]